MIPYLIRTFRGGISDENSRGIPGSYKYGYGLDIHGRDDILACSSTMATINESTVTDLIRFFVPARDGSTYAFGATGSIYSVSGDAGDPAVNFVYNDENGDIKGAAEWQITTGGSTTAYLVWATNSSLARAAINGSVSVPWAAGVATQDFKTVLDRADWHTMANAAGQLNIANGNYLASLSYVDDFDPADLNIRPGNLIKCLEERDDFVIMGSTRQANAEEGHIWSWIITATNWIQKKRIPVQGVNSLITAELMLLQGGDDGEIFFSDFVNSTPMNSIPGGGKTDPGGVSIENDLPSFGFYGGTYPGIWNFGRRQKNRSLALNHQYRLAKTVGGSTISTIGALAVINGQLLASWGTTDGSTSDYGIDAVSTTTRANALYEGLEFDAGTPHLKKMFDTVKLTLSPLASGTSVSVKYRLDNATTGGDSSAGEGWKYAIIGDGSTTFSQTSAVEAIFSIGNVANIYEVGLELNASGSSTPEVHSITTYLSSEAFDYA